MKQWLKRVWDGFALICADMWNSNHYSPLIPPPLPTARNIIPLLPKGGTGASRAPGVITAEDLQELAHRWKAAYEGYMPNAADLAALAKDIDAQYRSTLPLSEWLAANTKSQGYWRTCGPAGEQEWVSTGYTIHGVPGMPEGPYERVQVNADGTVWAFRCGELRITGKVTFA